MIPYGGGGRREHTTTAKETIANMPFCYHLHAEKTQE